MPPETHFLFRAPFAAGDRDNQLQRWIDNGDVFVSSVAREAGIKLGEDFS